MLRNICQLIIPVKERPMERTEWVDILSKPTFTVIILGCRLVYLNKEMEQQDKDRRVLYLDTETSM